MRKVALATLLPLLLFGKEIDFQDAWSRVQLENSALKSAKTNLQRMEKLNTANTFAYLPKIDINATFVYLSKPIGVEPKDLLPHDKIGDTLKPFVSNLPTLELGGQTITSGAVKIMYPLYAGGSIKALNELGKLKVIESKENLRLKTLNTFEQLVALYYGVILNQEILKMMQEIEMGHKLHLEDSIKLQKAGQIAKIEVLGAQVAYDRSKNETLKAKDSLEISTLALNNILSYEQDEATLPKEKLILNLKKQIQSSNFFVQKALQTYPALNNVENSAKQAKEASKMIRAKFLPEVGLFGAYSLHEKNSVIGKSLPDWFVGVSAKLSLLDNMGSIHKYQASKIAQIELSQAQDQAKKDMSLLVEKTYKEALHAKELYFVLNSSIELAKENLRLQEKAFSQGMGTSTKVVDARNTLLKAQIEQKSTAYKYIISLSRLMALSNDIEKFYSLI